MSRSFSASFQIGTTAIFVLLARWMAPLAASRTGVSWLVKSVRLVGVVQFGAAGLDALGDHRN
jgi:hypothetical protein